MTKPVFFEDAAAFRDWLDVHAASATALLVGFCKVASGRPSLSWSESVDEALCHGWIDGVRRRIDDEAYSIRFTPRKPTSIWSAVNVAKVERLQAAGRMKPVGIAAYGKRTAARSSVYAYEQVATAQLTPEEASRFTRNKAAWRFFESAPPSYRKQMLHWVCTAKRAETRAARLGKLMEACAGGVRLR